MDYEYILEHFSLTGLVCFLGYPQIYALFLHHHSNSNFMLGFVSRDLDLGLAHSKLIHKYHTHYY